MDSKSPWQGTVYQRKGRRKLWIKVKDEQGRWVGKPTPFLVGQEAQAQRFLAKVRERMQAGEDIVGTELGPVTVRAFSKRWLLDRRALGLADVENDNSRLEHHILPLIGELRVAEVRPRHILEVVRKLRIAGRAARTVRNVYSVAKALFREAAIADLIDSTPCILTSQHLGQIVDKDPEWRESAVYSRAELEQLITDPRIPEDRHVLYGLLGIGMLRHGEAAGLRWRHLRFDEQPLGRMSVATSYNRGRTKTKRERRMPMHPTLAAMLAEWKLGGWARMMGRLPEPDDVVVPMPASRRIQLGKMRTKNDSWKRVTKDLLALELRHRRGHDLRRTGISLAREDGADRDVLRRGTHAPPKDVMELYTTVEWARLCTEVAKLKIGRKTLGAIGAGGPDGG